LDAADVDASVVAAKRKHYWAIHEKWAAALMEKEAMQPGSITPEYVTACVRRLIGRDTVIVNEGITNYSVINNHMICSHPGTRFTSGASSLGWNGGAAVGMKMAAPDKTVVCQTRDGSFKLSVTATEHWIARNYQTPIFTVVYNNGGWRAPRFSMLGVHPEGYGSREPDVNIAFDPSPDYGGIAAAAGGAYARKVEKVEEVEAAIAEGLRIVREEKRCAVLDMVLAG
jgi:acetolactate synthase-1/2/3 large subunit